MGDKIDLKLDEREVHGKKVARLRDEGLVPGVVYGAGFEPISVQLPANVLAKTYKEAGKHHPIYLTIGTKKKIAMIKDADIDPVKNVLQHVSFHAVKQDEKVEAQIPIHLIGEGESAAEKAGYVILQNIEQLEVKAFPMDLPDALEVSMTELTEPGDNITVADIKLADNVEFADAEQDTSLVIATVYEPSALAAANDAAGGEAEVGDEAEVDAENGEDTPQGGADQAENPGGKKAKEEHGE